MADIRMITDIRDPALDCVLQDAGGSASGDLFEPNPGIFIAESPKVVQRALDGGYEPYLFGRKGKWKVRLMRLLSGAGIFRFIWQNRMYLRDLRALSLQEDFYVL